MRKYERYKASGVAWIGEIPSHWNTMRIKFYCHSISSGATPSTSNASFWDGDIPWIPSGCCHDCEIKTAPKFITKEGLNSCSTQIIPAGTTVMAMTGATCSQVGYLTIDASTNQSVMSYIENKKVAYSKFLFYLLIAAREYVLTHQTGGAQAGIDGQDCSNLIVPLVPKDEQIAIAKYLDIKCTDIDKAIATQQKRIDLFKEQEQVIIVSAVLNGLTSKVEMLDSKIPYIGKIPAHWTVMPLKYTAQGKGCCFIDGDWIESKDISTDGIKYLTTGNVGPNKYKEQGSGFITEDKFKELDCKDVYPEDLLISRLNEPIARTCIVPELDTRIVTAVDNVIFRPNPKVLTRHFAAYYLNNAKFTEHANIIARGATMHRISRTMLGHLKIALPPVEEQKQIVSYLDKQTAPLESAISNAERKIDLLRSYKQSLITEVVTGKRKVI